MNGYENIDPTDYPDAEYGTELMQMDKENGNYLNPEPYRHSNIVTTSMINGQFSQARKQCARYGMDYGYELAEFEAWKEEQRNLVPGRFSDDNPYI